jgi:radical SAM protein with 4Fe4S-binding SPASM domain
VGAWAWDAWKDEVVMMEDASVLAQLNRHAVEHNIPLGAHIDLTYRCDLACIHCYLEERVKHELTLGELERVLDELEGLGCLMLLLSGGDLFLRPDALEILRAACQRRFFVQIITHAGHITEEIAEAIAQMGVAEVKVSIYSSRPEVHDRITKLPGSLRASLRAISWLRERGVRVEMKCPIMEGNQGAQLELPLLAARYDCAFALDHAIRSAQGHGGNLPVSSGGGCHDLRALNLDLEAKAQVIRLQHPDWRSLADVERLPDWRPVCTAGRSSVYIDPEGNVTPCLEWEEVAGNVREAPLSQIWRDGEVFLRARGMTRGSFGGCRSCENFSFCALCPGKAHRESGAATGVSPSMCRDTTALRVALEDHFDPDAADLDAIAEEQGR